MAVIAKPPAGIAGEQMLWGIEALCRIHGLAHAPELLRQAYPPPHTVAALQHAAQSLGLRCAVSGLPPARLPEAAVPCLCLLHRPAQVLAAGATPAAPSQPGSADAGIEAEASSGPPAETQDLALLLQATPDRVLIARPGESDPQALDATAFAGLYAGQVIQSVRQPEAAADADAAPAPRFGFRWFLPELLKHKALWREVLLASLAMQLVALVVPLCTQVILDKVIAHQAMSTLAVIAVALGVFLVFTALLGWTRQYLLLHTGNRVDAVLGARAFEHLFSLSPRWFERRPTGVLIARLHGVETIREFLTGAAVTVLLDLPFLALFIGLMFWYSWPLTLLALALIGLITAISLGLAPVIRARLNRQFLLGARNQAFLTEYVSGLETVKSLQMEPLLKQRYGRYLADYLAAGFATRQLSNSYQTGVQALEQLMSYAILCAGAYLVMRHEGFTIGMLVAFQMFASRVSQPLLRLSGLWQEFQQAAIAVARLGDVLDAPPEPHSLQPARARQGRGHIRFEGLGFRYGEHLPWLYRGLNLELPPGQCLALMGPSGCGKSTLTKLLQGFYQPQEGRILLDGADTRHLVANELRQYFGVVPQDTVLFTGTVLDNLLHASPHASFDAVVRACQQAGIHAVIEQLPQGYQTEIGEHGAGLSGGQKQRVAIARALLKQPRVLIFDEATSSLDRASAEAIAATINQLKGQVSVLFIAHQLPRGLHTDAAVMLGAAATAPEEANP
jgi:subfamily B ATP-binding cassette protein HlyB/CyaB